MLQPQYGNLQRVPLCLSSKSSTVEFAYRNRSSSKADGNVKFSLMLELQVITDKPSQGAEGRCLWSFLVQTEVQPYSHPVDNPVPAFLLAPESGIRPVTT
uniref:Uncharacterized protein n=1 Tax=Trichuris muris TaxID=70415 RepID=A0A5S6QB10_TRIMR